MSRKIRSIMLLSLVTGSAWLALGCAQSENGGPPAPAAQVPPDAEHGHKAGAHGGLIVPIGQDNYHAEAVFEKGGVLKLFTLGRDEARVLDVESQTLNAYARPEGGTEAVAFTLTPAPQPGDAAGKTSLFVGRLPKELAGKRLDVSITGLRIDGERYRLGFASAGGGHEETEMPEKVADAEEKDLYFKPGGKYTAADIRANGGVTAPQKFQGLRANHDLKPKAGEKICPVTLTKANPQFTWVVDGKPYQFCCPPCVDEFVKTAKERPDEIKEPSTYVKK